MLILVHAVSAGYVVVFGDYRLEVLTTTLAFACKSLDPDHSKLLHVAEIVAKLERGHVAVDQDQERSLQVDLVCLLQKVYHAVLVEQIVVLFEDLVDSPALLFLDQDLIDDVCSPPTMCREHGDECGAARLIDAFYEGRFEALEQCDFFEHLSPHESSHELGAAYGSQLLLRFFD